MDVSTEDAMLGSLDKLKRSQRLHSSHVIYMYSVSMATGSSLTTFIPLLYNVLLITLTRKTTFLWHLCFFSCVFIVLWVNQIPVDSMPCLLCQCFGSWNRCKINNLHFYYIVTQWYKKRKRGRKGEGSFDVVMIVLTNVDQNLMQWLGIMQEATCGFYDNS